MRTLLLGVTGWANPALRAMIARGTPPVLVATRAESAPSPHFPCENLSTEARRRRVPVREDASDAELVDRFAGELDLVLSVGFHRKLGPAVAALAPLAVNVHPSLLPAYRGSAPTNWMLLRGETIAGATVHELTQRIDGGDVLLQRSIPIGPDETAGALRSRQAELMAELVVDLLGRLERGEPLPRIRQDENNASRFPKMTAADGMIDVHGSVADALRRIRATTPWPGARILVDGVERRVLGAVAAAETGAPAGSVQANAAGELLAIFADGALALGVAREPALATHAR